MVTSHTPPGKNGPSPACTKINALWIQDLTVNLALVSAYQFLGAELALSLSSPLGSRQRNPAAKHSNGDDLPRDSVATRSCLPRSQPSAFLVSVGPWPFAELSSACSSTHINVRHGKHQQNRNHDCECQERAVDVRGEILRCKRSRRSTVN